MVLTENKEKITGYRERASKLVSKMTLEEKVDQTLHSAPAIERLGIPAYNWWNEALHGVARAGVATVFPQAIGLAATFDEDLIEQVADAISTEGRAKYNMQQKYEDRDIYKGLTFWSPNVNIFRDPRWGRGHETFGEDPYLTSRLGVRFVKGIQGNDENYLKAAACAKHFAVHSGPEDVRHSFDAIASKQDMRETYLPAFKACVQEGKVEAIMGAYNRTNGEPCCGHKELLQDILRGEWEFLGHVVSDCWAIKDFHEGHHVTDTPVESVAMAMNNGCDLNCGNLFYYLKQAVEEGLVSESRLDEALVNLFTTRMKLGVFDEKVNNPYDKIEYDQVDSKEMQKLNRDVAAQSIVLLKNENQLLPLDPSKLKTVGVIGPNANNRKALVGNYEGTASRYFTILEGIQQYLGDDVRVMTSEGCHLCRSSLQGLSSGSDRLSEVQGVCENSDVVIACLGLDSSLEGEEGDQGNEFASGDKKDLNLPGEQQKVLELIYASKKPVILVLLSGSALAVTWADEHIKAIIQGWYPGAQGGMAIAEILFGKRSPEGKMPVTFYRGTEQLPAFTDYSMKNRTYRYMKEDALYPFGYGLSYSKFVIDNIHTKGEEAVLDNGLTIFADIQNTGDWDGGESVQVYVKICKEDSPNAQLKGLHKVHLKKNESQKVEIHLPVEAFALYDEEGVLRVQKGQAICYVGTHGPDKRSNQLCGTENFSITIDIAEDKVL
ncbi:glycoside hydrolase family 3 C-terminal domain-containing protein [Lachnospiraceae bacterium OttesenSCG-928-D06]|nr:glycoside hydrolase family 3 C-terminal domain-containing protein [Lachnospiraceae bacterium OttesenSCG-928-D06]